MKAIPICLASAMIVGCSALPTVNKHAFNTAHHAFVSSTYSSSKQLDTTITVRIRAFGSAEEKCRAWLLEFPHLNECPSAGVHVSTEPAQIWLDLRENDRGRQTVSTIILGHEIKHELQKMGLENPDNE